MEKMGGWGTGLHAVCSGPQLRHMQICNAVKMKEMYLERLSKQLLAAQSRVFPIISTVQFFITARRLFMMFVLDMQELCSMHFDSPRLLCFVLLGAQTLSDLLCVMAGACWSWSFKACAQYCRVKSQRLALSMA